MYTKKITYTDYDGNKRTEELHFNLTKPEVIELQLSTEGGLDKFINKVVEAKDMKNLVALFKQLIQMSYGEKSEDGRRFIKNKEITDSFMQTEAYSELFMLLATNDEAAAEFFNGIMPKIDNIPDNVTALPGKAPVEIENK